MRMIGWQTPLYITDTGVEIVPHTKALGRLVRAAEKNWDHSAACWRNGGTTLRVKDPTHPCCSLFSFM